MNPLEYAEEGEDLFTDDEDLKAATEASLVTARVERPQEPKTKALKVSLGAKTLRDLCAMVIMRHHQSITDIGEDMLYEQIHFMLDICERPQLEEIENNSPQLQRDTDHLWQGFMRKEYGKRYNEVIQKRQGKPVKSWRKQFRLAKEWQEERAREASSRLKENYARLQEEKLSKRMVVISTNLEPPPKKKRSSNGWGTSAPPVSKLDRIRRDTSTARRALTHASGLARPSPSRPSSATPPNRNTTPRTPVTSYKYETPGMSVTPTQTYDPFRGTAPRVAPAPKPPPKSLRPIVKPAVKNFRPSGAKGVDFFNER